jgi:amidase
VRFTRSRLSSRRHFCGYLKMPGCTTKYGGSADGIADARVVSAPLAVSNNLLEASAAELARLIRQRRFSSREIVEAHLRRIEQVNSRINAVVQLDSEGAMRSARAADESLARGVQLGPLHGIPFTVKDWIETEGLICAAGLEERRTYVPSRDATVVVRLKSAGGILLRKTNVGAGAPVYPRPNSPCGFDRSPGASSSGEAAIIAAGGVSVGSRKRFGRQHSPSG